MTPGRLLVLFAFYAAALDLGTSRGLVGTVASPVGLALLLAAGALLAWRAARAARSDAPVTRRLARLLAGGGGALVLLALPASFATRDARSLTVGEGQAFEPGRLPGLPAVRFGEVSLAPEGPHLLSKTVSVEAAAEGDAPVRIGLFPPTAIGPWRLSVFRFGYAVGVTWLGTASELVQAYVMLGTLPHAEEEAALVQWTPEPNVMMGAGTFPPRLEELVSPPGAGAHLFVRVDAATIAGARRDLRDPDAYRWLVDGRLEDPEYFVQVFREKEKVFEGKVRGGEAVRFPGGAVELERKVLLWVDLLAVRDPLLPWAAAGLALLGAGLLLRVALGAWTLAARLAFRASGS
jgi:hypothetical protein